jgi:hypothetical protein
MRHRLRPIARQIPLLTGSKPHNYDSDSGYVKRTATENTEFFSSVRLWFI